MAEVVHSTGKPASMISLIVERASRDARNEDFTAAADAGLSEVPIAQRLFTERRLRRLELNLAGETQCPHEASEVLLRRLEELQATFMARVAAAKPSGVSKPSGVFKSAGIAKRKSAPSDDDDGSTAKSPAKPTATSPDEVAGDALCRVRAVSCDVDDMDLKKGLRKKWRIKLFSSLCPEGNDAERRVAAVGLEAAAYDVAAKAGKAGRGELYDALLSRFVKKAKSTSELRIGVVAKKHSPCEMINAVAAREKWNWLKKDIELLLCPSAADGDLLFVADVDSGQSGDAVRRVLDAFDFKPVTTLPGRTAPIFGMARDVPSESTLDKLLDTLRAHANVTQATLVK